jgi:hypothetical protein
MNTVMNLRVLAPRSLFSKYIRKLYKADSTKKVTDVLHSVLRNNTWYDTVCYFLFVDAV